jgi:hypothetical protein
MDKDLYPHQARTLERLTRIHGEPEHIESFKPHAGVWVDFPGDASYRIASNGIAEIEGSA